MQLSVDIQSRLCSPRRVFDLAVRFEVKAELAVIYGPSGAGKSVTLQAVAGLLTPDAGLIRFGEETLFDSGRGIEIPARERRFGYVFQDYALFPHRTVNQNVAAALAPLFGHRLDAQAREHVAMLLSAFELTPVADSYPNQISGGQRQRTALARALAARPRLLLLDEPFNALDTDLRERTRRQLLDVHERFHVPIILITHDAADASYFGRDVVRIEEGGIVSGRAPGSSEPAAAIAAAVYNQTLC